MRTVIPRIKDPQNKLQLYAIKTNRTHHTVRSISVLRQNIWFSSNPKTMAQLLLGEKCPPPTDGVASNSYRPSMSLLAKILLVVAFALLFLQNDLRSFSSPQEGHIRALVHTSEKTNSTTISLSSAAEVRTSNLKYYKERYQYHPPTSNVASTNRTELCGSSPQFHQYFTRTGGERSRLDEDRTIFTTFFSDTMESGTYIELGAYNGITESNTRFFDQCLGWEGLLIEGNRHEAVWPALVRNRPNAHRMNFVPSCSLEEQRANRTIPFHQKRWTNAAIGSDGVESAYKHIQNDIEQVPCGSLTHVLLDLFPHGHVSFFSLDVEGSEPLILEKVDFSLIFIEMLMVEVTNSFCQDDTCETRQRVRHILRKKGYRRFSDRIPASDVFIHSKSALLNKALNAGWNPSVVS